MTVQLYSERGVPLGVETEGIEVVLILRQLSIGSWP